MIELLLVLQLLVPSIDSSEWTRINQLIINSESTLSERIDMGLMVGSISMSSIALGITMSCTSTGDCVELNPVMRKFIGDSPTNAIVFKSLVNGGAHYAAWRLTKGKTRKIVLVSLFAFNTWDAIHDIRQMRKINR